MTDAGPILLWMADNVDTWRPLALAALTGLALLLVWICVVWAER